MNSLIDCQVTPVMSFQKSEIKPLVVISIETGRVDLDESVNNTSKQYASFAVDLDAVSELCEIFAKVKQNLENAVQP